VHIAQRYAVLNPGIWNAPSASRQFEAGLACGITAKSLMAAVEANKGRKPNEIVDALKPKMEKPAKKRVSPEEVAKGVEKLLADDEAFKRATQ
jgi:hypothetical protein